MSMEIILLSALVAGLFGSLHCAGMCGGIASALGVSLQQHGESQSTLASSLFFQLGRISSYFIAGCIAGAFGDVLTHTGYLKDIAHYLRLFSALFIIALGLYLAGFLPLFAMIEKMGVPVWKKISPLSRHLLPVRHRHQAYSLGFLWGWLPCGLTYSMLLWSVAAGNGLQGGMLMLAFGLGTIPAMLSMTLGSGKLMKLIRLPWVRKLAGGCIVIAGVFYMLNMMSMTSEHQGQHEPVELHHR